MSEIPPSGDAPFDPAFVALEPGFLVGNGRFTMVRLIGRGGMGVVWLARDESLREDVALKFLPNEIRFDAVALDDLRRETARSRKLTHPNIIRIHDLFKDEREAFISMEYVDGPNLSDLRLEQTERVFTWKYLEPLVKQLCEALDYAHSEKVIHRDLKPANMMLDSRGRLKLSDFGIAAQVSDSISRVSMVRHGKSGTVTYMSPQQMDGKLPQVTDDIYALGATLYELLTSRPPFYSGDIAHQVRNLSPQPIDERLAELEIQNEVPPAVAALIMACLGKSPEQRPTSARAVAEWIGFQPVAPTASDSRVTHTATNEQPSRERTTDSAASEMRRDISKPRTSSLPPIVPVAEVRETISEPVLAEEPPADFSEPVGATEESGISRSHLPLIAAAFAAVVVIGLGVGIFAWWLWDRAARRDATINAAPVISSSEFLRTEHVLAGHSGPVSSVAFSPDQKFLISGSADGTVRVYGMDKGDLQWTAKADIGPITAVTVSRESKLMAVAGGTGLMRLYALPSGSVFQTLRVHSSPLTAAAFSPGGTYLASADEAGSVSLWDYEKGATGPHWNAHNTPIRALAFAPDGRQLATGGSQDALIRIWNAPDGAAVKSLKAHQGIVWSLAYSPDGSMLVSSSRDRSARIWSTKNFSVKRTVQWNSDMNLMHAIAFSPDARFLVAGSRRSVMVYKVETAARGKNRDLKGTSLMRCVAFSPDGSALAAGGENGLVHIWPFRGEAIFGEKPPQETPDNENAAAPAELPTANPATLAANAGGDATGPWITLFDGGPLTAWQGWDRAAWHNSWEILNGELRTLRGGNVGLATREEFSNFELEFEWKVAPGANSGVFYRVPAGTADLAKAAPEFQVVDDATPDGSRPITAAGSIYGVVPATNKRLAPVGSFNTARIVVRGPRVEHWLNGSKVLDADLSSPAVRRVGSQRFQPGWAQAVDGQIVLQNRVGEASFRNIRIRKLSGN
jgi:serine/threonine protein kinase/WD40 repeat protein